MALLLAAPAATGAEVRRLEVVAAGKSAYAIVVPDAADPGRIGRASTLLQSVVAEATPRTAA